MTRTCTECGGELPTIARRHTVTCSARCRKSRSRRRAAAVPAQLTERDRWVRHDRAKRPLTVLGRLASSTNPATWSSHTDAAASTVGAGLGFVLNGDGITVLDLDHCLVDGRPTPLAERLVALAGATYVEVSPSGTGLHIWGYADLSRGRRLANGVECYGTGRYVTVTGEPWRDAPAQLGDITAAIRAALEDAAS